MTNQYYYHALIETKITSTKAKRSSTYIEYDHTSLDKIKKNIILPFKRDGRLTVNGYFINSKDITRIIIRRSTNKIATWINKKNQEINRYPTDGVIIAAFMRPEHAIMSDNFGENITNELLAELDIDKPIKSAMVEQKERPQYVTYNIHGDAKINQGSIDNSINISSPNRDLMEIVKAIRDEIQRADIDNSKKYDAMEITNSIEIQIHQEDKRLPVINALVSALPALPTIVALGQSLLSMITK